MQNTLSEPLSREMPLLMMRNTSHATCNMLASHPSPMHWQFFQEGFRVFFCFEADDA
jgi:hypothetical protein